MSAPAIISGDFSTFRHVQGRKVLQLVIEIPAEQAASVFSTFGYPGSGSPIPVAVARLDMRPGSTPEPRTERRGFSEMPYATQAAMRCSDTDFERFLTDTNRMSLLDERPDRVAIAVRAHCGVKSRGDIGKTGGNGKQDSGFLWRALDAEYYAWQRGMR